MRDRGTPKTSEREQLEREIAKRAWKLFPRKVRRTFSEMIYLADDFDPRRPAIFISKFQSLLQEARRLTEDPAPSLSSKQMWGIKKVLGYRLRSMSQRLQAYPGLVDSEAGWRRNAAGPLKKLLEANGYA